MKNIFRKCCAESRMPACFRRTPRNRQKQECSPRNPEEKQLHLPLTAHFEVYHQNFPVPGQKRRYQAASGTGYCSDHKQGRSAHSKGVFRLISDVMPGYPSRHRCSVRKYRSKIFPHGSNLLCICIVEINA